MLLNNRTEISYLIPYIYYLTGLTTYNPYIGTQSKSPASSRLPSICLFAYIMLATSIIFVCQYIEYMTYTEIVINIPAVAYIIVCCFTCVTIASKSLSANQAIHQIWFHLNRIGNYHKMHYTPSIDMHVFYRRFSLDIALCTYFHVQHIAVKAILNYGGIDVIVKMLTLSLLTITLHAMCHALFYIRLLLSMMAKLNDFIVLASPMEERIFCTDAWNERVLIERFKLIKRMYCLFYDISDLINQHFGWIFVAIFVLHAYDVVHTTFWFFWYLDRNTTEPKEKAKLLSKYSIVHILDFNILSNLFPLF